jgi:hypothetical protein
MIKGVVDSSVRFYPLAVSHLTATALGKQSVWNLLKQLENEKFGETNLSSQLSKPEQITDTGDTPKQEPSNASDDCGQKVAAIAAVGVAVTTVVVGLAANASLPKDSPRNVLGTYADIGGLATIAGGAAGGAYYLLGGCTETNTAAAGKDAQDKAAAATTQAANQAAAQQASSQAQKLTEQDSVDADATAQAIVNAISSLPAQPSDPSEWKSYPGAQGTQSTPGQNTGNNDVQPGNNQQETNTKDNDDNTDNSKKDGTDDQDKTTDDTPTPETPGSAPTPSGTPDPDGSDGVGKEPPGFKGPWPPESMPNPDDADPPRPSSMPNGSIFVPLVTFAYVLMHADRSVSYWPATVGDHGITTFQLSLNVAGLGSG